MTTQAGPDGQGSGTQTGSGTGAGQQQQGGGSQQGGTQQGGGGSGDGEQWRNVGEVKQIIAKRDKLAADNAELQKRLDAIEAEKRDAGKSDEAKRLAAIERERDEAKNKLVEAEKKETERSRQDRRRAIADAILDSANPERKEELRLMLPGLHEDGEIDLYAEDAKAEGKKALEKLRKRLPALFKPAGEGADAGQRRSGRDLTGLQWNQLTTEEQKAMSPEDFHKHFGRGAGGRRPSALFGSRQSGRG